ncbi:putative spermidine/putrescine transport system permease protein [Angulomicrobium tetraedrale]|uniref:Putative spermidine/putrescine transport system permease protein n=1 Tax=Ancylobacter tetraedralis TaxID=217068 RepID=A0A839ZGC7_9HYPH|nr:ABC transporter permease [Ancylobacter tetraedralis]MBB3774010.1 putative spermidine/putrescine transport system permease protein [Ancylobacter tetraedralis]
MNRLARFGFYLLCGLIAAFLVLPLLVIVPLSFNPEPYFSFTPAMLQLDPAGLSLRWYREIAESAQWRLALRNSLSIAAVVTPLATLLGTMAALGLRRLPTRPRKMFAVIIASPLVVPVILFATGIYFFLAPLGLTQSFTGIILAHTALAAPYVVVTVGSTLTTFDERLLRAASILGSPPLSAFFKVTLPLVAPGIASGALFAFVTSFDEAVIALFLAGYDQRTIPLQMWSGVRDQLSPAVLAAATLMVLLVTIVMLTTMLIARSARSAGAGR